MNTAGNSVIVVGVDGSPASQTALRWAIRRAAAEHATVTAVEVNHPVWLAPGTSYAVPPYGVAPPLERAQRPSRLHDVVRAALGSTRHPPQITELHADGEPGVVLARVAETASMRVLGRTPHGRLAEFLLGSVATDCLRHAQCPVVLIPSDATI